ncbi:MAG: glycosyltransferase [archaeon]
MITDIIASNAFLSLIYSVYEFFGNIAFSFFTVYSRIILDFLHIIFDNLFYFVLYLTILMTLVHLTIMIIVSLKKSKYVEKPLKDSDLPTVTIQIPTYNELAALHCAKKCLDFDYPKNKFNIMIGDDSSDKSISKQINAFALKHKDMITVTRRGSNSGFKPGNLNHMLKSTKGDFIVVFDSDFLPEKDFLRRIVGPFMHDKNVGAVQARWLITNFSQNLSSVLGGIIPMFSHRLGLPFLNLIKANGFIAGSAEAIRKNTLVELGGWQSGALTEDIEYSLRLTRAGKKIVYLENLGCNCETPFTPKDLGRQQMRWAYGVISALKKHLIPILFSRKIPAVWKVNAPLLLSGYLITFQFFLLAVLGFFSIITNAPQAIDWARFFSETFINIVLTSGLLVTSVLVLKSVNKVHEIPRMLLASFSVGLLVIYTVSVGVVKAIFNRPMQWFILAKKGNVVSVDE